MLFGIGLMLIAVPVVIMINGQIERLARDSANREMRRRMHVGRARRTSKETIYRPSGEMIALRPTVPSPAEIIGDFSTYSVT